MLILASASPRRQELLRNAGIAFHVHASDVEEGCRNGESATDCALRLAQEKAVSVSRSFRHDVVLGADTLVVVDGMILGKPNAVPEAAQMLRLLSGRSHEVVTGVCLVGPLNGERATDRVVKTSSESTRVSMTDLSERDIADYVATGEPMDKAGAYAIQGIAARWIPRIEGDYSNVVGLPVALVWKMLKEFG
jgi:septum formation protein